jgi:hypothetical protein
LTSRGVSHRKNDRNKQQHEQAGAGIFHRAIIALHRNHSSTKDPFGAAHALSLYIAQALGGHKQHARETFQNIIATYEAGDDDHGLS